MINIFLSILNLSIIIIIIIGINQGRNRLLNNNWITSKN